MERIHCSKCGKSVSTEVPDDTIVRAWVECPECVKLPQDESQMFNEDKLISWIRNVPHTKIVPLVQELIEMLVCQEMIAVREDGVPYHAHTGDLLI